MAIVDGIRNSMKPRVFVNDIHDQRPKTVLFESGHLWVVVEDKLEATVKQQITDFVAQVLQPLLSRENSEVKVVVETTTGRNLYELHKVWKEGFFPKVTKFEMSLGKHHSNTIVVDQSKSYIRMEINQIEGYSGHGSWYGYSGEYTSVLFDEVLEIIDTKSERTR